MSGLNPSTSKRPRHSRSRSLSQQPSPPGSATSTIRQQLSEKDQEDTTSPTSPQPPHAGPSGWQPPWPQGHRARSRVSMGPESSFAGSPVSMEDIREGSVGSEGGPDAPILVRDTSTRAPRSMMACTRCRRQKMKCDGPMKKPCRGCLAANQPCVFEARGRPKSIATMPQRPPPFTITPSTTARPESSTGPSVLLPAPAGSFASSTSTSNLRALPQIEAYGYKSREPMPPPTASVLASASPLHPPAPSPVVGQSASVNYPPPASYSSFHPAPLSLSNRPSSQRHSPPPIQTVPSVSQDARLRNVEHAVRQMSNLAPAVAQLQGSFGELQSRHDALASTVSNMMMSEARSGPGGHRRQGSGATVMAPMLSPEKRARSDQPHPVTDQVWDAFRTRAWPLAPWLIGLTQLDGLAGWVVSYIGLCAMGDWSPSRRREADELAGRVRGFIGQLIGEAVQWTPQEIRAATIFAAWEGDPTLTCTVMGVARSQDLHRIGPSRSPDQWREWVHLVIFDQLSSVPDFNPPVNPYPIAAGWRDRIATLATSPQDLRDRDAKLLAWAELGDMLVEVHHSQSFPGYLTSPLPEDELSERNQIRLGSAGAQSSVSAADEPSVRERERDRDRTRAAYTGWFSKLDAWASSWLAEGDPILSLHFHYAVLFTASPVFLASPTVWHDLAAFSEGYQQLERAREAAFAVIKAVCSPDIGRSLPFSYNIYRPYLGLAIVHLIAMTAAMPHSSLVSLPHIQAVIRSAQEHLAAYVPIDPDVAIYTSPSLKRRASGVNEVLRSPTTILSEIVETGQIVVLGKREVLGREPGRALWCRLMGR